MVSRKRSRASKQGWYTRRKNAFKNAGVSEKAFEIWNKKIPKEEGAWLEVFKLRFFALGEYLAVQLPVKGNLYAQEAITQKIENPNEKMDYFFAFCRQVLELDDHEIKTILFSPPPVNLIPGLL